MPSFDAEVLHVVPPDDHEDHDLTPYLARHATDRYLVVCRRGEKQSWLDRVLAFLRRDPIEAITLIADDSVEEGAQVRVTADETEMAGVFDATEVQVRSN